MSRFLLALALVFSLAAPAFAQASPILATGSSADSLLVSGKQMLRAGEDKGSLDAMYAAKAAFERALADICLGRVGPLLHCLGRLPHRRSPIGCGRRKQGRGC